MESARKRIVGLGLNVLTFQHGLWSYLKLYFHTKIDILPFFECFYMPFKVTYDLHLRSVAAPRGET